MSDSLEIKSIQDIYDKVSPDKWNSCLSDLYQWLLTKNKVEQLNEILKDSLPIASGIENVIVQENSDIMFWVDDGKEGISEIKIGISK